VAHLPLVVLLQPQDLQQVVPLDLPVVPLDLPVVPLDLPVVPLDLVRLEYIC
jgi:hypothetical protein